MPDNIARSAAQLGRGIRKLRKQKGWNQDQLAVKAGLNRATLSLLEGGKSNPSFAIVENIADSFGTTVRGLMACGRKSFAKTDPELKKIVGFNVKSVRESRGLARAKAAEKVGLIPQYFSTTENGRRLPTLRSLLRLASALEVCPSLLLIKNAGDIGHYPKGFGVAPEDFHARILGLRLERGLTRNDLAMASDVSEHQIFFIERKGTIPTIATVQALSLGLGVSLGKLIDK